MNKVVEERLPEPIGICQHNGIKRLELFGSGTRNDFDPATSDPDFLAVFKDSDRPGISESYLNTLREFEQILRAQG